MRFSKICRMIDRPSIGHPCPSSPLRVPLSLPLSILDPRTTIAPGSVRSNERSPRLIEARLVARLPYLRERDRAVEPVKDAERKRDPLHDGPREEAVEVELDRVRHHFLRLERVDHPHGQVADEQEGDHLPAGLAAVVLRQVDPSAGHVRYEQHLEDDLRHREEAGQHDEEVRLVGERGQRAGDHAEHGVDEEAEARHAEQDVVEVALLLGLELQALHPYESHDNGHDREDHQDAVRNVREVNGDQAEVRVVDQHEEQDQADQRADQQQQAEEQPFARSYAVHPCVTYFVRSGDPVFLVFRIEFGGKDNRIITRMSQRDRSSRQHGLEAPLEVGLHLVRPTRVSPDVFPHHVDHRRPDQAVLDYEREQIRLRVLYDRPHNIHPPARIRRDLLVR